MQLGSILLKILHMCKEYHITLLLCDNCFLYWCLTGLIEWVRNCSFFHFVWRSMKDCFKYLEKPANENSPVKPKFLAKLLNLFSCYDVFWFSFAYLVSVEVCIKNSCYICTVEYVSWHVIFHNSYTFSFCKIMRKRLSFIPAFSNLNHHPSYLGRYKDFSALLIT